MSNRNANVVLFSTLAFFGAQNAWADCAPAPTAGNDTITCNTTDDTNGVNADLGDDSITVDSGFVVSNSGADAIDTGGGLDGVTNDGSIQTSGNNADGIQDPDGADVITNTATGTILTTGTNSAGIRVDGNGDNVTNAGSITTGGSNGHGIAITGDSNVIGNTGTLSTGGTDATGVSVQGSDNFVDNYGAITTTGQGGEGFDVNGDSNELDNDGSITTGGDGADGIEINGNDNHADNYSAITTTGDNASGVLATGNDNRLHNLSGGTITTSGDGSEGMAATGDSNAVSNYSTSTISTSGDDSEGLSATGASNSVSNYGTVTTTGEDSAGLMVSGTAGVSTQNTATNGGSITTSGDNAVGILGASGNDNLLVNDTGGTVSTSGVNADGMRLIGNDTLNGLEDEITNSGSITTTGNDADGISLTGDDSEIVNTGSIGTTGGVGGIDTLQGADGIEVDGNGNAVTNTLGATINTTGTDAEGIRVSGDSNTVQNDGSITTSGTFAEGILVEGTGNTVTNSATGTIATSGPDSDGIATTGSGNTVTNNGTVTVTGNGGNAVSIGGTGDSLVNTGTIQVLAPDLDFNGVGDGVGVAVVGSNSGNTINNSGTITTNTHTAIITGSGADTVTSSGNVTAVTTAITTGAGNDAVTLTGGITITGDVDGGANTDTLTLDGTGAGQLNGDALNFESLDKDGTGSWTVTGGLAQAGTANINAGTLVMSYGTLDASTGGTTIDSGATLELIGSNITGNVFNDGTLDTTGNLFTANVSGAYTQGATGSLEMITGVSSSQTDVQATGAVTLDGNVDVAFQDEANVPFGNSTYNIVFGSSRTGTFATEIVTGITDPGITILDDGIGGALVSYDASSAFLALNRSTDFLGDLTGLNEVQAAAGGFIDQVTSDSVLTSGFSDVLLAVVALDDEGQKQFLQTASTGTHDDVSQAGRRLTRGLGDLISQRQDLTRLTGDVGTAQQASLAGLKLASNSTRGVAARESQGPAGWLGTFGGKSDLDNDDGRLGYDADWYGAAAGFDMRLGSAGLVGLAAGAARMDLDLARNGGSADVDATFGGLYGGWYPGPYYVEGRVSYTALDYEEDRNIFVGPTTFTADSDHDGDEIAAVVETGMTAASGQYWQLNPFLTLNYGRLDEDGYSESGAGPLNHVVQDRLTEYLTSELGAQFDHLAPSGGGELFTFVRLGWVYDFDIDDRALVAGFEGTPGRSFSLDGRDLSNHGARLGAGMTWLARNDWSVGVNFGGEWRGDETAYAAMLEVSKTLK